MTLPQMFDFKFSYSATSHGKGAVDGIGATMKQLAKDAMVTSSAIIKNADSLLNTVSHKNKIHLTVITEEYI